MLMVVRDTVNGVKHNQYYQTWFYATISIFRLWKACYLVKLKLCAY